MCSVCLAEYVYVKTILMHRNWMLQENFEKGINNHFFARKCKGDFFKCLGATGKYGLR